MKDGVSRRELVMLSGAGLATLKMQDMSKADALIMQNTGALAPDNPQATELMYNADYQQLIQFLNYFRSAVRDEHYGRDPHDITPDNPAKWEPFKPKYIVILYLKPKDNWELEINHASFEMPLGNDEDDRRIQAIKILKFKGSKKLKELSTSTYKTHIFKKPNLKHQPGHTHDSEWFKDFNFASQNEIFIYIDREGIALEPGDLLSFKMFGVTNENEIALKYPNYSYFHAREVPVEDLVASGLKGRMIRVENYVTKENGKPISSEGEERLYSMNIKFRIKAGAEGAVTMLIDPETGNGTGHEP